MDIKFAYIESVEDKNPGIPIFRSQFKQAIEEWKMLGLLHDRDYGTEESEIYYRELCTYINRNINSYLENRHREL